ncbi:ZCCHC3 [Branchiostoma lanceolatum]|uniref:ZCCHC3 protein n=1 Tax=Branchiostoma lanceolatum TaxID=7740 RepID=A0A8J9WEB3_BRALA|nr:ZCCHC3 [Branchiostoma lanceolatum]
MLLGNRGRAPPGEQQWQRYWNWSKQQRHQEPGEVGRARRGSGKFQDVCLWFGFEESSAIPNRQLDKSTTGIEVKGKSRRRPPCADECCWGTAGARLLANNNGNATGTGASSSDTKSRERSGEHAEAVENSRTSVCGLVLKKAVRYWNWSKQQRHQEPGEVGRARRGSGKFQDVCLWFGFEESSAIPNRQLDKSTTGIEVKGKSRRRPPCADECCWGTAGARLLANNNGNATGTGASSSDTKSRERSGEHAEAVENSRTSVCGLVLKKAVRYWNWSKQQRHQEPGEVGRARRGSGKFQDVCLWFGFEESSAIPNRQLDKSTTGIEVKGKSRRRPPCADECCWGTAGARLLANNNGNATGTGASSSDTKSRERSGEHAEAVENSRTSVCGLVLKKAVRYWNWSKQQRHQEPGEVGRARRGSGKFQDVCLWFGFEESSAIPNRQLDKSTTGIEVKGKSRRRPPCADECCWGTAGARLLANNNGNATGTGASSSDTKSRERSGEHAEAVENSRTSVCGLVLKKAVRYWNWSKQQRHQEPGEVGRARRGSGKFQDVCLWFGFEESSAIPNRQLDKSTTGIEVKGKSRRRPPCADECCWGTAGARLLANNNGNATGTGASSSDTKSRERSGEHAEAVENSRTSVCGLVLKKAVRYWNWSKQQRHQEPGEVGRARRGSGKFQDVCLWFGFEESSAIPNRQLDKSTTGIEVKGKSRRRPPCADECCWGTAGARLLANNNGNAKAFDRVDHSYMAEVLGKLGFGPNFQGWIGTLYKEVSSRVLVNGDLSSPIHIERGVRQGCPLSPLLYVLCIEPLAAAIRADPHIRGVKVPGGPEVKLVQYADDNTCVLSDQPSIDRTFLTLRRFEAGTGSKLNLGKTVAVWLGRWRGRQDEPYPIGRWTSDSINILGSPIGGVKMAEEAWLQRFAKFKGKLDQWRHRKLTLIGKVVVCNFLAAATLWYTAPIFPLPKSVANKLEREMFAFIWDGRTELVARRTLYLPKEKGGLGLVCIPIKARSLLLKTVRKALTKPDAPAARFTHYWLGLSLRRIDPTSWNNSSPHSVDLPPHYEHIAQLLQTIEQSDMDIQWASVSVAALYTALLEAENIVPRCVREHPRRDWPEIWKSILNPLLTNWERMVCWSLAHDGLVTNQKLHSWRRFAKSPNCPRRGCEEVESVSHVFYACPYVAEAWTWLEGLIVRKICPGFILSESFVLWGLPPAGVSVRAARVLGALAALTKNIIWRSRGDAKHNKKHHSEAELALLLKEMLIERLTFEFARRGPGGFHETWAEGFSWASTGTGASSSDTKSRERSGEHAEAVENSRTSVCGLVLKKAVRSRHVNLARSRGRGLAVKLTRYRFSTLFYSGQPRGCHRCGSTEHFVAQCKVTKCAKCWEEGHTATECSNQIKCSLCLGDGHAARACPVSYTNAVKMGTAWSKELVPNKTVKPAGSIIPAKAGGSGDSDVHKSGDENSLQNGQLSEEEEDGNEEKDTSLGNVPPPQSEDEDGQSSEEEDGQSSEEKESEEEADGNCEKKTSPVPPPQSEGDCERKTSPVPPPQSERDCERKTSPVPPPQSEGDCEKKTSPVPPPQSERETPHTETEASTVVPLKKPLSPPTESAEPTAGSAVTPSMGSGNPLEKGTSPSVIKTPSKMVLTPPFDSQDSDGFGDLPEDGDNKLWTQELSPVHLELLMNKSGEEISPLRLVIVEGGEGAPKAQVNETDLTTSTPKSKKAETEAAGYGSQIQLYPSQKSPPLKKDPPKTQRVKKTSSRGKVKTKPWLNS